MSFRKRNVVVALPGSEASSSATAERIASRGVRPSPLDGRLTTSTGTRSLDALLAGHAGSVLGTSLLIEERGTTDFGGALLRYYAAEGVVQGHHVHVLGMNEAWARELPGLSGTDRSLIRTEERRSSDDKMKIAWRYERLGEFAAGARERPQSTGKSPGTQTQSVFCHDFDITKRLTLPPTAHLNFVPLSPRTSHNFPDLETPASPFTTFLNYLITKLSTSPTATHRVIIPSLLSPAIYSPNDSKPENILQFLHALRALLRKFPAQLTAIITLPLALHPRRTGLTRWMELLCDGVLELASFPSTAIERKTAPTASTAHEELLQGMLKIHRLPVFHEKGGGGGGASGFGDDLAFTLSRRKGLVIKPFSLPPVEGDSKAESGGLEGDPRHANKVDIDF